MKLACNLFLAASLTVLPCVFGSEGPCDIFDSDGSPCVAAHSLVRALYGKYDGPLYQVKRSSDNATIDVATLEPGGFANARSQDDFCEGQSCIITRIYDQSDMKNDLDTAPAGGQVNTPDEGVDAARFKLSVGGNEVYGAYFDNGQGYRRDDTKGIAVDDEPESMYMVVDGKFYNSGCCFDYGNAETDNLDDKAGTMEAMYWGNNADSGRGTGSGPWIMADLEDGLWPGNESFNPDYEPIVADFVTAMLKGGPNRLTLKGGSSQGGLSSFKTQYDGARNGVDNPMKKQGAIILGIGGDNSNYAVGIFFEGAMTKGISSDEADDKVAENIASAGYGQGRAAAS